MEDFENINDINLAISQNLKKIRKQKGLSLDQLAAASSVSKSMLGQIERGESSPTVNTLWKIAVALHISFTSLLEEETEDIEVIDIKKIKPLLSDQGKFKLYATFPYNSSRKFEMLYITLEAKTLSESKAHESGTSEYIIVYEGIFEVIIGDDTYTLNEGEAIRYNADVDHAYHNPSESNTKICMIIHYE